MDSRGGTTDSGGNNRAVSADSLGLCVVSYEHIETGAGPAGKWYQHPCLV